MVTRTNSGRPLVTIAIPTYNRAATFLAPCLESALRQTYGNIEVIVADNGSTDRTAELLHRYQDPRLRCFRHEKNTIPNDNFNFCLREARGDYFLLLLDDEAIDPDFIESCLREANFRTDIGLIRSGVRTVNGGGTLIAESPNDAAGLSLADFYLAWFSDRTAIYLCNTLFNRAALASTGGFASRHNLFQDVMAQVRVADRMPRVDVRDIKATTRQHGGQYTYAAKVAAWCEDSLDLLDLMCRTVPSERERVRKRGLRFFATIGYSRANAIHSPTARLNAYAAVFRTFGYRYAPPVRLVLSGTAAYRSLRQVKRRILHRPAWVE